MWRRKKREERTPAGGPILRHDRLKKGEFAVGDPELMRSIEAHLEKHFGEVDRVWHEIVSMHVHVDVLVVAPTAERPVWVLVTCGMSARPMQTEDGPRWAELMVMVPDDVELFGADGRPHWVVPLLQQLAHFPHDYGTLLWIGHTVPNGEPYAPSTEMCCAFVANRMLNPEAFDAFEHDGHTVEIMAVYPLLPAEVDLKLERGADALWDALCDGNVAEVLREGRASVV